jgi:hypothetical protein
MLPDHQKKKNIFYVWSGRKRVLMHLRMLPDPQKHGLEKNIFLRLEWLKTRFEAFAHASRPPEKKSFFTSGVVKNVF